MTMQTFLKDNFLKAKEDNRKQIEIVRRIGLTKRRLEDLEHYAWQYKLLKDNYKMRFCQKDSMKKFIESERIRFNKIRNAQNFKRRSNI